MLWSLQKNSNLFLCKSLLLRNVPDRDYRRGDDVRLSESAVVVLVNAVAIGSSASLLVGDPVTNQPIGTATGMPVVAVADMTFVTRRWS